MVLRKNIAHDLSSLAHKQLDVLGLKNRSAGFIAAVDSLSLSTAEIKELILENIGKL